ncbi:SAP domain-containing ribonucleoprotein [Parasteatoda tepidariorum]|uniref:SAP domain-containing ribonucleoprotein n=1 Tax=Parasteatoda tepidariorum TaxID=114398 RepID=UPI00077FC904|nr:SAP domain-containing ribonucleoprotein [Parasteatoda tepidariorum]
MSSSEAPSATAQVISKNGSPIIDIDNMKVPELKKRLKSMGLPTSGNKAELIERLQEAYLSEKDGSLDGTLDDESLEEALLNDDPEQSAIPETVIGTEEFSFSSPEKDLQKVAESNVSKPLKKRVVAQTPSPTVESPKPSKIVLKRDNYPTIEPPEPQPTSKKDHPLIEAPKSEVVAKATKILTASERLQLRAKRFNIDSKTSSDTSAVKVTGPGEKVGSVTAPAVASAKGGNLDVLRKRAERFGENVSTVMKQLENQEKLLKRKMKFTGGAVQTVSSTDKSLGGEQDKKKQRLERFGLVK